MPDSVIVYGGLMPSRAGAPQAAALANAAIAQSWQRFIDTDGLRGAEGNALRLRAQTEVRSAVSE
jgi:hypothetical protein